MILFLQNPVAHLICCPCGNPLYVTQSNKITVDIDFILTDHTTLKIIVCHCCGFSNYS